jgi:hypothetical protein
MRTAAALLKAFSDGASSLPWRLACRFFLPLLMATALPTWADIYSFTDGNGIVHLSNHDTDAREVLLIQDPAQPTARPKASVTPGAGLLDKMPYANLVDKAAQAAHLDRALLHAVIAVESAYNPAAISPKGARGLMQLMPETARRYGVKDILDPAQNIRGGSLYLKALMQRFNDDLPLTLAAYNAGENAIARHGNHIPPYHETQSYVARVLNNYRRLTQ